MALQETDLFLVNREDGAGNWQSYKISADKLAENFGEINIGVTPPANPSDGGLWFNSNNGIMYTYYINDGETDGQWVDVRPPS